MMQEERAIESIKNSVQVLCEQIKHLQPTALCNSGEIVIDDSLQVYASFLKSPESDTLDICILIERKKNGIVVSADVVKGGSGDVLSEMPSVILPINITDEDLGRQLEDIRHYVLSQKLVILEALQAEREN